MVTFFSSFFPARFIWKYEQPTHLRKSSPPTYLSLLLLIFAAFLFLLHLITFLWLFPCVAVAGGADSPFRRCLHCGSHCTIRFSPWQTVSKGTALHQIKEDQNEQVHTTRWWVQVGGETKAVWGTEGRETTLSSFVPPPPPLVSPSRAIKRPDSFMARTMEIMKTKFWWDFQSAFGEKGVLHISLCFCVCVCVCVCVYSSVCNALWMCF